MPGREALVYAGHVRSGGLPAVSASDGQRLAVQRGVTAFVHKTKSYRSNVAKLRG